MASSSKTDVSKDYFAVQNFLLRCLGLSQRPNEGTAYKIYSICILMLIVTYPIFALPGYFKYQGDLDGFLNSIVFLNGLIIAMIKHLVIFTRRAKVSKILYALQNDVFVPSYERGGGVEELWIKNCVDFTKKQAYIPAVAGIVTIIFCALISYVTGKGSDVRTLPFGTLLLLTERFNSELVFWYQSVVFVIVSVSYVTTDTMYASIIAHICVQCKFLQNYIKRAVGISYTNMNKTPREPNIQWKYLEQTLKQVILFHTAILEISEQAETVFSVCVFTEFTGLSISICCLMYHASLFPMFGSNFVKDYAVLLGAIAPLFVVSYWGNKVIVESQAVADACYEVDFTGTDVRFQKGLMLIMLRSQKPITLTVGKFAAISLVTILSFCRTCYSYYMFLNNINDK